MNKKLTSRQEQSIATRSKIFTCATALFAQKSYEKVKISDICRKANVSIGAFYHHFPTKESILNEGYREFDKELQAAWLNYTSGSTREAIHFLIQFQLESISRNGCIYATQFFKNQLTNEVKYILDSERFFYQTIKTIIENAVAQDALQGSVLEITEDILSVSRGTIYDWCLHDGKYELIPSGLKDIDMVLLFYQSNYKKQQSSNKVEATSAV